MNSVYTWDYDFESFKNDLEDKLDEGVELTDEQYKELAKEVHDAIECSEEFWSTVSNMVDNILLDRCIELGHIKS